MGCAEGRLTAASYAVFYVLLKERVIAAITVIASSQPKMWSPAATQSVAPCGSKSLACPSAGAGISTSSVYRAALKAGCGPVPRGRVALPEHQPSGNERGGQPQQGTAGSIPVPGEGVLQPPPPARRPGTLPPALALLGQQDAAGLIVVAQPPVVSGELLIWLRRVTQRPVQPVKSLPGRHIGQLAVGQPIQVQGLRPGLGLVDELADLRARQVDRPVGLEPLVAVHFAGDHEPVGVRAGPSLPFRRAPLRISWPPMLAPDRLTVPSAWKPSSQYMLPVTVSRLAVRAGPSLPFRRAPLRISWPPMLAPTGRSPVGLEPLVAVHVAGDGEPRWRSGRARPCRSGARR